MASESLRGSNCSGSNGASSRVLTLANTGPTSSSNFKVFVNGLLLVSSDYTASHLSSSSTVTFSFAIYDTDYIFVEYYQGADVTNTYTSAQEVYNRSGLTSSEIDLSTNTSIIASANAEVELITGRKFTNGNVRTEILSGGRKDIFDNSKTTLVLSNYPIQSVTSFLFLNVDGTTNTTLDTVSSGDISGGTYDCDDYWLEIMEDPLTNQTIPYGKVRMKVKVLPTGYNNIKVAYTYGYSTVPTIITTLATCIAGIRAWVQFLGGQYNRLNSYSIPQQTVDKGDFYQRGVQMIAQLDAEANMILDRVGRRSRTSAFATGGAI